MSKRSKIWRGRRVRLVPRAAPADTPVGGLRRRHPHCRAGIVRRLLLPLSTLVLLACGGGPVSIGGRVIDHRGTPVAKAEVHSRPETDMVVTNTRGFFVLRQQINDLGGAKPIPGGLYRITARKQGFEDVSVEVSVDGGLVRLADLILVPRTPDIGETPPEALGEEPITPDESSTPKAGI